MQKHTKVYLEHFGYHDENNFLCEVTSCFEVAVDIHHIIHRAKFGKTRKDEQDKIENLIGLCRRHHAQAHYQIEPYLTPDVLQEFHQKTLGR